MNGGGRRRRRPGPPRGPFGGPGGPRPAPPPRPLDARRGDDEEIEYRLLNAARLLEAEAFDAAKAEAGEAVYRDPHRAEGFLLLGDIHLGALEPEEAADAYRQARRKARRQALGGDAEAARAVELEAFAGEARCHLLLGNLEQAAGVLKALLDVDRSDPLGAAPGLAEVLLRLGRPDGAVAALASASELPPEAHVVAALAHLDLGDTFEAVVQVRRALLGNFYLLAHLLGEEPPEFGIRHGVEEATPEHAADAGERLRDHLESRPDRLEEITAVAATPSVQAEVSALLDLALRLNAESGEAERTGLQRRIDDLRSADRIRASNPQVLEELGAADRPEDGPPGCPEEV